MVMTEGGIDQEGQTRLRRDRQGQRWTGNDKEGGNDLVMTEGRTYKDKEGQTRTMRVVMTEGGTDNRTKEGHSGTMMGVVTL